MALIKPHIGEYKILQIGDKEDKVVNGIDYNLLGQTNVKQCAYVVKRSALHVGNDSFPVHVAGILNIPVVALYGPTTIANHGPYWYNPSSVLLESSRNGSKANFSRQESPKTVNMIRPEEVANAVLKILGKEVIKIETLKMGERYGGYAFELIPDVLIHPNNLQNKNPTIRLDYHFNEENAFKTLTHTSASLITNKPINLEALKHLKKNLSVLAFEVNENTDIDYLLALKHASLPIHLFSKETDNKKLSKLRAKFFNIGFIDFLDQRGEKPDDFKELENLKFKSSKIIIGKGKTFASYAHYLADIQNDNVIDSEDFWKDLNFFWIFKNNG